MKFDELINGIEKAKGVTLPEHELMLIKKLWNACVDCIADEWPVLSPQIRMLKQPQGTNKENDNFERAGIYGKEILQDLAESLKCNRG